MLTRLRDFLDTRPGQIASYALGALAFLAVAWVVVGSFGRSDAARYANDRVYIDAETGEVFYRTLRPGDTMPVEAPSGKRTGYEAERCYWTADGKPKTEPTFVLLNEAQDKPGPTYCPDCKRRVVAQNPAPLTDDAAPPPTEAEAAQAEPATRASR